MDAPEEELGEFEVLDQSFKWEVNTLYLVLLGGILRLFPATEIAGGLILEYAIFFIFIMDANFTIRVTHIFLKPIREHLRSAHGAVRTSKGYKLLQETMVRIKLFRFHP